MKCSKCKGRKVIEILGGVIVKRCPECKGRGEIEDDIIGGIEQDDKPVRVRNTRKPRKKYKTRKVSTA